MNKPYLDHVLRPVTEAKGLPNAHYTDPSVIAEENTALLRNGWAGLAVASDVPEPGDARPLTFLGEPLLLIRGKDGDVRVFHNVCRHRGMILVEEPRKIEGAIRCPYHSWCYSTDGRLVTTPHVGGPGTNVHEAIDRNSRALIQAFSWVPGFREYFAVKATPNPHILRILFEEGCGMDCSSMAELILSERIGAGPAARARGLRAGLDRRPRQVHDCRGAERDRAELDQQPRARAQRTHGAHQLAQPAGGRAEARPALHVRAADVQLDRVDPLGGVHRLGDAHEVVHAESAD